MNLKSSFVQFLNKKYPALPLEQLESLISDQLLSPFHVTLSKNTFEKLQTEITSYQKMRDWSEAHLKTNFETKNTRRPQNTAVCTSYDFHIDEAGQPKLIEINTNAAFLALGLELYDFLKHKPETNFTEENLVSMFKKEIELSGSDKNKIYILDEKPTEQRLYIEFLVYQQIFAQHGLESRIIDLPDVETLPKSSFIYNRYTDFFLNNEKSAPLKKLFDDNLLQLSPHPYEYFLLADKQRLNDWNLQTDVEKPESLLKIYDLGSADKDFIWSIRKTLFFKPKNSYGSKQAYKGANISRKTFDEFYGDQMIAQDYAMPAEMDVVIENIPQKLKYDLRCYAYDGKLQLMIARLYQGQTTNLRTVGGGFAIVKVE